MNSVYIGLLPFKQSELFIEYSVADLKDFRYNKKRCKEAYKDVRFYHLTVGDKGKLRKGIEHGY